MVEYSYLAIILASRVFQHYFNKKTSVDIKGSSQYISYGAYRYILSALMALVLVFFTSKGGFNVSPAVVAISSLSAVSLTISLFCSLEAMKQGAMVLVSLAGSAGLLIPCVLGIFMFGEPMSAWQFGGIALLLVSAYLLVGYSKKLNSRFTPRTMLLLLGSMLTNGTVMLAQKMFSHYVKDGDTSVFSFLTFGIAGVLFLIMLGSKAVISHEKPEPLPKKLLLYGVALSVILLMINQLSTIAAAVIPSAILFPVNDGGSTIISALVGAAFFKEKLTMRSVAGIILGIGSLVVINLL